MKELICPNCGKPFQVDDADYAKLLGQVKNDEFQAELNTRIEELHAQWESEHQVAELREAQKKYAATDAWACIRLYAELCRMKQEGYHLIVLPEEKNELKENEETAVSKER